MPQVALTIDLEQAPPPFLSTWRDVDRGLPLMLELLAKHDVQATFLVTGRMAERSPESICRDSQKA